MTNPTKSQRSPRLDIAGAVATIDTLGCQKKLLGKLSSKQGEYVLSLKGNQGSLHEDVATYFSSSPSSKPAPQTVDVGGMGVFQTTSRG